MNRMYKLYLQQMIIAHSKRVVLLYAVLLLVIFGSYFIKNSYDKQQFKLLKEREALKITSSKATSVSVNRDTVGSSFLALSKVRQENKESDRQYVIETLTFYAQSAGLMNFIIDNIAEKTQTISTSYKSLSSISNLIVFEAEMSFGTVLSKDLYQFIDNMNRNINGIVVVQRLETKRSVDVIDEDILRALNIGQNLPLLGHKMVVHWFFVKNV